jgi:hypothetical protein
MAMSSRAAVPGAKSEESMGSHTACESFMSKAGSLYGSSSLYAVYIHINNHGENAYTSCYTVNIRGGPELLNQMFQRVQIYA